jgi:predicted nucleotidyltransferase
LITDITTTYYKMSDPNTRYRITAPSLTNLRIDGSGLTYLDLTGTNVTTLNIPPEMYAQLEYLKLSGSKVKVSGLLKYPVPSGAKWSLY